MNLFQLVLKQMRQRALSTWLTLISVTLGVALAVSILLMRNAGAALFGQTDFGYDVLVGVGQGSPLQLVLNTVYHIDRSPGNVQYWVYETLNSQDRPPRGSTEFSFHSHVRTAVPMAVGDTYKGRPIIGAPPKMFVSLTPLREQIDALSTKAAELRDAAKAGVVGTSGANDELAKKQADLQNELVKLRADIKQLAIDTTPLIVPADPLVEPSAEDKKWRFGKPAALTADAMLADGEAARVALSNGKPADAVARDAAVVSALDLINKAAGAESGPLELRPGESMELAEGHLYHAWKFESVIGSEVAEKTGLRIGSQYKAIHGNPGPNDPIDEHDQIWHVVGILKPTHTAADRCLYIPLISFYCIAEHEKGLKAQTAAANGIDPGKAAAAEPEPPAPFSFVYGDSLDPDLPHTQDYIGLETPKKDWEVSSIAVKSRGGVSGDELTYFIKNGGLSGVQATNPAGTMREFFETFFASSTIVLLIIALLVSIVAAVGILVSIYNSISARNREIAILRALGATRDKVLTLICVEAGVIGLVGGVVGLVVGHLLGAVASRYMMLTLGQGFNWVAVDRFEVIYLAGVVVIALIAGFVPATKAYRTPVAANLAIV